MNIKMCSSKATHEHRLLDCLLRRVGFYHIALQLKVHIVFSENIGFSTALNTFRQENRQLIISSVDKKDAYSNPLYHKEL